MLCCTDLKMTEIKIQNGCWQRSDPIRVNENKIKRPNHSTAKTVLQWRTLNASKGTVNG